MRPILKIDTLDLTKYVSELKPTKNDLDADGSGRDIQTGRMYRTKITSKITWEVSLLRIPESVALALFKKLDSEYYSATTLNPGTNTQQTKTYYTSSVPLGAQKYIKSDDITVYDGVSFQMIER